MRTQLLFVLVVLVVLAAFAALNWTVLAAPAPLNVLVARIEAPLGLVMLAVAIALFRGQYQVPWGEILAGAVVATVPVAVIVLAAQRRIAAGLTAGAVKG